MKLKHDKSKNSGGIIGRPYSLCFPDQRAQETSGNPFLSLPVPLYLSPSILQHIYG